ncbi:hypothetical protein DFR57_10262 [Saliterribacillus persicus]|uniref:Uncharacterized protein n=1 Tax=Saliterribacillus persicus TaxID=930114 RepID=A0A368YD40_9BACI|nr:hypothetical protein DFR57_10262 [Saliterribacillus persicus]
MKLEYLVLILFIISLFFDWRKYKKDMKKAISENEIRPIFVRFLLTVILFLLLLVVIIF